MKKKETGKIVNNIKINETNVYMMVIRNIDNEISPGQFVNVSVPGVYLPRPISVADYNDTGKELTLIYRVVGEGTDIMSNMEVGTYINLLTGLGNGFDLSVDTKSPIVVGGGLGTAPLFYLVKKLKSKGLKPKVVLGFKNPDDSVYRGKFKKLVGDDLEIVYESDGLFVTNILNKYDYDYFYTCGPKPMLEAVEKIVRSDGEYSLESRMACGIGMCKCCSVETNDGMKTLCNDGPVLKRGTIRW